jgi:phage baseplate assembly protein W
MMQVVVTQRDLDDVLRTASFYTGIQTSYSREAVEAYATWEEICRLAKVGIAAEMPEQRLVNDVGRAVLDSVLFMRSHEEIREYIRNLRSTAPGVTSFLGTILDLVVEYKENGHG